MNRADLVKGIGLGMIAGAAIAVVAKPKKKTACGMMGRFLKSAGNVLETISGALGM